MATYKLKKNYQPFIGFEFDGIHSEEIGVKRVSSGNRYQISLSSEEQVYTNNNNSKLGVNFFKGDKTTRKYSLNIAFDKLTEANFNRMKKMFDAKKYSYLVLDEEPYKKIKVKCNGSNQIKWICFIEKGERIYKGEGTLDFINYTGTWEWVSPYLDYYYDIDSNSTVSISELERYGEFFKSVNLYFAIDGYQFNKDVQISTSEAKYCFITPAFLGKSYPIFYIALSQKGKELIKYLNFYQGEYSNPISCFIDNIQDDYLKIDLHNKSIHGMLLDSDSNFIYSGNNYSHLLNYSYMSEGLHNMFFNRSNIFTPKQLVIKKDLQEPIDYRVYFQFKDAENKVETVANDWEIIKVEYENQL